MGPLFCLLCLIFSTHASAVQFDPPDLGLEQELHRQYLQQSGIAEIPAITKSAYIESYRIQKGETLWSLSQTLYGDGHFWPRVWAQNRVITNPHLIRPGHTLQFLLGSEDETPSFRISEEDDSGVELASSANQNPLIEIPPPEIPPKPILKVPPSFPQWQSVYKQMPVRITDDKGLLQNRKPLVGKTYLTSFVQEQPLAPTGKYMETDLDSALPTVNQYIYVKVNKGTAKVGEKMLIVHDAGQLKKKNRQVDMPDAYLVQIAGELELSEPAKAEDEDEDYDVFRALITRATGLASYQHDLIPGEMQEVILNYNGTPGTTEAQIIGAGKHVASDIYGPGDVVFLNKGAKDGLAAGQILDTYVNRTIRKKDTEVKFSPAPSGAVRIVRVSNALATAVILGARDGLMAGDQVQQITSRAADREVLDRHSDKGVGADETDVEGDLDDDDGVFGTEGGSSDVPDIDDDL